MATKPLSPCLTPGCPRPAIKHGRCAIHEQARRRIVEAGRGKTSERGYGWDWQKKRAAYLKDNPCCIDCAREGKLVPATEVDHIVPLGRGGADDPSNYAGRCKRHHSAKTMRESVRRREG